VHLNPYGEEPVRFAVDLAVRPPATVDDLRRRCVEAGIVGSDVVGDTGQVEVEKFMARWLAVVDAPDARARADLLNDLLADNSAHPRLTDHFGGWHLHYRDEDLDLPAIVRALISVGTALHLTGRGMDRLRRCALAECANPFGDFTKAGRQRYCSPTCANRDAVRRHRAKKAAS
jgi:predicted RNA-binding Zn ribbon-like protein